jgi:hypothetical protein
MEPLPNPLNLIKDQRLAQDVRALYAFFTQAEIAGTHFTYAKIDEQSSRSRSTIRKYARNYWSWFLRKEPEKQGRSAMFSCQGLRGYPELYFVMAHQRNQGQYYRHFSEALLKAKEHTEARRAKLQSTTEAPSPPSPNVPDQQDPEEIYIEEIPADEEAETDELEAGQSQALDEATEQEIQEDESETTPGTEVPRKERMNIMAIWPFSRSKHEEQLEQIQKRMDDLERKLMEEIQRVGEAQRSQIPSELSPVLKELGQLQERVLGLSSLASQSAPLLEQVQGHVEHALPSDFPQSLGAMATRIQTIEQTLLGGMQQFQILTTLSQLPERLEQLQRQIQEVLTSISGQFTPVLMQTSELAAKLSPLSPLPESVEQLQAKGDELSSQLSQLLPLPTALQELQKQADELSKSLSQPSSVPEGLEQLQTKIDGLLSQFAQESPLLSTLQELQEQVGGLVKSSVQSSSVPGTLEQIQTKVGDILVQFGQLSAAWAVSERLGVELLPIPPSGEQKPDDMIKAYIQNTIEVIHTLEQNLTTWLDQHYQSLRENRKASSKSLKRDLFSSIEDLVEKHSQTEWDSLTQEQVPPHTETLPSDEQNIPPIDQPGETDTDRPSETDTTNGTAEEG